MTDEQEPQDDENDSEDWPWHNKAGRSDYCPAPFYYWDEEIPDCPRLVAWSPDCRQMRAVMLALLETFPATVDVLLKHRTPALAEEGERPDYLRWHGTPTLASVIEALDEFSYYVFKCGHDVLCIMNPDTREYVALDEFGILWYYTDSQAYGRVMEEYGFQPEKTSLVTEGGCYVATFPDQDEWRENFVGRLALEAD